ncbi:zinc-ribbon domain containing protein [Microbulbifer sp. JMSA002]|uniref:zinc-ribbon domain containing protein n=1 Tax=Microbulbifer sp. JMSA002 TaxID=3243368 RepID=UPI0040399847
MHHSYYIDIPLYYLDREFQCKDCGSEEVWTAKQQKWWYEIAKGDFETSTVRCRPCRKK